MPRFAANLTLLFNEVPLPGRFEAARAAGFEAVEVLFPYEMALDDIAQVLGKTGLKLVLINTPAPDWAMGGRGCAAMPGYEERFRAGFVQALTYARALEVPFIHLMAGMASGGEARRVFVDNLRWAAQMAPEQRLTIEPINPVDMPGYYLNDFNLAAEILDTVAAANLGLQFDAYHAHRISGDVMGCWDRHGHRAQHVQVAGGEGRHEPLTGAIDYPAFFARLDAGGYAGYVSGEYLPRGRTEDGLGWTE